MRTTITLLVLSLIALVPPPESPACAVAPRRGESVGVNGEEAIIVHDGTTEHFVRRADFRTTAKEFGFLVPTPTKPGLGEADAGVFGLLRGATLPRREFSGITRRVVRTKETFSYVGAASAPTMRAPVVVEEKTVAGFDAVVLKADDVDGLKKWLEERQFDSRPALMEWVKWYVQNGWYLTAFKISHTSGNDRWAKAVRMSFATRTPFYPYREPADMQTDTSPRSLKIFTLTNAKQAGRDWPGRTVWANSLPDDTAKAVSAGLKLPADAKRYLTEFEDKSSPRPGTKELYFEPANDTESVERPVIYYDATEYVDEDLLGRPGLTVIVGAAALAAIAFIGYLVVVRQRRANP